MNALLRRIDKLEGQFDLKHELRVLIVAYLPQDLRERGEDESHIELDPERHIWGIVARGAPFTAEEIRTLKEKYQGRHGNR